MLRAFIQRWDEAAKRAPPGVAPPPEPDAAPPSTPPIAEAAEPAPTGAAPSAALAGCQYDNQCKGDRIA